MNRISSAMRILRPLKTAAVLTLVASVLQACGGSSGIITEERKFPNIRPTNISADFTTTVYDGITDDLLTAGLGRTGLASVVPPGFVAPEAPTAAELRRRAIWTNYRALVDMSAAGGFGTFYGPNIDAAGVDTKGEGKIAGEEWIAYSTDFSGVAPSATVSVLLPASFDPNNPCIVAGASSGSRGVYGAIGTAGEWGLKRGCAVALTDKGTGMGAHDLQNDTVNLRNGTRGPAATSDTTNFKAIFASEDARKAYVAANPNRWAFKHAHLQSNVERAWGSTIIISIEFANYVINQKFGDVDSTRPNGRYKKFINENTLVIAAGVSNGGGAALTALEIDLNGAIDGVVAGEPQIAVKLPDSWKIQRGALVVSGAGKGLLDYTSLANLLQPCASQAKSLALSPALPFINPTFANARCDALLAAGYLDQSNPSLARIPLPEQALLKLGEAGWEPESSELHASHYAFATPAISVTYFNSYARGRVEENLCGFSYAATGTDGKPTALSVAATQQLWATGNGVPPTGGINLINDNSVGGPLLDALSVSKSSVKQNYNFDGAQCIRETFAPISGKAYTDIEKGQQSNLSTGIELVRRTANLRAKPTLIVHGRSDALVPVNMSSRPYLALNSSAEGANSKLSYIEVTNAQHFDSFIGSAATPGFDTRFVPLHVYFNRAMDTMYASLKAKTALPPSQVVRTIPRGGSAGAAPPLTAANLPPIAALPLVTNAITIANQTLTVPE